MKKDLVCQEDFDRKMWGVVPMTEPGGKSLKKNLTVKR